MSAKIKLNIINAYAALLVGAIAGAIFESWLVFFVTAAALFAGEIYSGDIRIGGGGGKSLRR